MSAVDAGVAFSGHELVQDGKALFKISLDRVPHPPWEAFELGDPLRRQPARSIEIPATCDPFAEWVVGTAEEFMMPDGDVGVAFTGHELAQGLQTFLEGGLIHVPHPPWEAFEFGDPLRRQPAQLVGISAH
ncbi:MAG: hypothetical protein QGI75_09370 [Phycisphaerales bacterium]|nr:hypothetical protein [Phycisphaerales bacterium]